MRRMNKQATRSKCTHCPGVQARDSHHLCLKACSSKMHWQTLATRRLPMPNSKWVEQSRVAGAGSNKTNARNPGRYVRARQWSGSDYDQQRQTQDLQACCWARLTRNIFGRIQGTSHLSISSWKRRHAMWTQWREMALDNTIEVVNYYAQMWAPTRT